LGVNKEKSKNTFPSFEVKSESKGQGEGLLKWGRPATILVRKDRPGSWEFHFRGRKGLAEDPLKRKAKLEGVGSLG